MTAPTTISAYLADRRAKEAAATEGPWNVCSTPPNPQWISDVTIFTETGGHRVADTCTLHYGQEPDAEFIAVSRNDYAKLLDVVEAASHLRQDAIAHEDGDDRSMTLDVAIGRLEAALAALTEGDGNE